MNQQICPVCESSFDGGVSLGTRKVYCSPACSKSARLDRLRKRRTPEYLRAQKARREAAVERAAASSVWDIGPMQPKAAHVKYDEDGRCRWCGGNLAGTNQFWCSHDCMVAARKEHKRRKRKQPTKYQIIRREFRKIRGPFLSEHPLCSCGRPATQVHHVLPLRDGGTNDTANLAAVCASCHYEAHPDIPQKLREGLLNR